MSTHIKIQFDLSGLSDITAEALRHVVNVADKAVEGIAIKVASNWKEAIRTEQSLSPDQRAKYIESIRVERDESPGIVSRCSVIADFDRAEQIENGTPARDLKAMLQTSRKTKLTKQGKKYLTIPIRHNTPGHDAHARAMPKDIHNEALKLGPSHIIAQTSRVSASGHTVPRRIYQWNRGGEEVQIKKKTHLTIGALPAGLAPKLMPGHKTDPYAGMRRMDASSNGQKSSVYLTFRVMTEDSSGWIIPAKPGLHIAQHVAEQMEQAAQQFMREVVEGAAERFR